jgi:hypothetical protein
MREAGGQGHGTQLVICRPTPERPGCDFLADGFEHLMDPAGVLSGEDYGELLAAKPGRNTGGLGHPTHYAGDIAQHLIAGLMPPSVVESLEVIDIEHGQGQGPMLGFGLATGGIQLFVERLAIGQICQRVCHRVAAELFKALTGVNITQVCCKGSGFAVNDLIGDPMQWPTVEVIRLAGYETPTLEEEYDFDNSCYKYKVTHVIAAKAVDWRNMAYNAGV